MAVERPEVGQIIEFDQKDPFDRPDWIVTDVNKNRGEVSLALRQRVEQTFPIGVLAHANVVGRMTDTVPPLYQDKDDWWLSYECLHGDCPETSFGKSGSGLVLELRVTDRTSGSRAPLAVKCPTCSRDLHFRSRWRACSNGYGSTGGPCRVYQGEPHFENQHEDKEKKS